MFFWQFHFVNEIPISCLFAQWKWTYILDLGPWRWSAFNMGFVDKWPSRMQGQWFFRVGGQQFLVEYKKSGFFWRTAAPAQIYLPWKVREGKFNVPPNEVDGTNPLTMLQIFYRKHYIALITRKDIYELQKL
jgi:hypothetical protein